RRPPPRPCVVRPASGRRGVNYRSRMPSPTLVGRHVRLEPLDPRHAGGLAAASASEGDLYKWSPVPRGAEEVADYIAEAISWRDAGTALPFATVRQAAGAVLGARRFFRLGRWPWPPGHPSRGRSTPDACEIGYTWLTRSAIRTAANTEAKLLMLTYAFEEWHVLRVCLHTDERNERSRAAIERIGGRFEGILRSHRIAADLTPRNSARYSIVCGEWPDVKRRLGQLVSA